MKYKVSVLPQEALIANGENIKRVLGEMKIYLNTPLEERESFAGIQLLNKILAVEDALNLDYKYTNQKPEYLSSIIHTTDMETRQQMKEAGLIK